MVRKIVFIIGQFSVPTVFLDQTFFKAYLTNLKQFDPLYLMFDPVSS